MKILLRSLPFAPAIGCIETVSPPRSRLLKAPGLLLQHRRHAEEHLRKHHPSAVAEQYLNFFLPLGQR